MKLAKKVMLSLIAILSVAICSVIAFAGSNYKESVVGIATNGSTSSSEVNIDEITSNEKPSTITYAPDTISVQKGGSTLNYAYSPSINAKDSTSTIAYEYIFGNTMNRATAVNLKSIDTTGVNVSYAYSTTKLDTSSEITGEIDYTLQQLASKGDKVYIYVIVSPIETSIPTTFTTSIIWYYGIPTEIKIENNINNEVVTQAIVSGQKIDSDTLKDPTAPDGYYFDAWYLDNEYNQLLEEEVPAGKKVYARYHNFPLNSTSNFTYTNGSYVLSAGNDWENVIVPTIYNDGTNGEAYVTTIGGYAFEEYYSITNVDIPVSVVSIGEYAFGGNISLTTLNLKEGLTSIGNCAFTDCAFTSVKMPKSIESIASDVFHNCTNLINVDLSGCTNLSDLRFLRSLTESISDNPIQTLNLSGCTGLDADDCVFGGYGSLTSINLENTGLTSIGEFAFASCGSLTSVTLPSSITSISGWAFHECSALTSVNLSSCVNLTSIGDSAFESCVLLTSVTIPSSVTKIGSYAFTGCDNLSSITFENTSTWYYTSSSSYTSGTSISVTNASTNATYFTSTYEGYYWYKQ